MALMPLNSKLFLLSDVSGVTVSSPGADILAAIETCASLAAAEVAAALGRGRQRPTAGVVIPPGEWGVPGTVRVPQGEGVTFSGLAGPNGSETLLYGTGANNFAGFYFGWDPLTVTGDRPNLAGILDSTCSAGTRYGFDCSGGRFLMCYEFLSKGVWASHGGNPGYDYWEATRNLTVDILIRNLVMTPGKVICGNGDANPDRARPWSLRVADDGTRLCFSVRSSNHGLEDQNSDYTALFTPPSGANLRLTCQFSFQHNRFAAWGSATAAPGLQLASSGPGTIADGLYFSANDDCPWQAGSNDGFGACGNNAASITSYTLGGVRVTAAELYTVGSTGSTQARVDGATITDNVRYFYEPNATFSQLVIGYLPLTEAPGSKVLGCVNSLNESCDVYVQRTGQGGGKVGGVRDLSLEFGGSCVLLNAVLQHTFENLSLHSAKGACVVAGTGVVLYPIRMSNITGSGGDCVVSGVYPMLNINGITAASAMRQVVRNRGGSLSVRDGFVAFCNFATRYPFSYRPGPQGACLINLDNIEIDNEGGGGEIDGVAEIYRQDGSFPTTATWQNIVGVNLRVANDPVVRLRAFAGSNSNSTYDPGLVTTNSTTPYSAGSGWTRLA